MAGSRKPRGAEAVLDAVIAPVERMVRMHARPGAVLTVGLSGGIDSVVLLDALRIVAPARTLRLDALHINHGLSPNAAAWEAFCRRHCARRGVPFEAVRIHVQGAGANVEAQARLARYRAFSARAVGLLALAHNEDDQAETVLLRLVRGAGVRGLAGMPQERALSPDADFEHTGAARVIRPLLTVSREAIHAYARGRRLRWIEDESNQDRRYARNFLRHEILPRLEGRFPGCRASLARAASHLRDAGHMLEAVARDDLGRVTDAGHVDVEKLASLGPERGGNALRHLLETAGEPALTLATTQEILRQLTSAAPDAAPALHLSRVVVRRYRGRIVLTPGGEPAAMADRPALPWSGTAEQRLPDGSMIRCRETVGIGVSRARLEGGTLCVRGRRGGERVTLRAGGPSRTLKNLLQEQGVPPWVREAMPLLYCNEQLVWIPGVGVAAAFQARPGEAAWEFRWDTAGVP